METNLAIAPDNLGTWQWHEWHGKWLIHQQNLGTSPDGLLSQESILECRSLTAPPIFLPLGKIYCSCSGLFLSVHLSSFTQLICRWFSHQKPQWTQFTEDFPTFDDQKISNMSKSCGRFRGSRPIEPHGPHPPPCQGCNPWRSGGDPIFLEESYHFFEKNTIFWGKNTIVLTVLTAFHKSRSWQNVGYRQSSFGDHWNTSRLGLPWEVAVVHSNSHDAKLLSHQTAFGNSWLNPQNMTAK